MKLGLYSITYLGLWYRGEALTLPQMISRAKKYGYDGIEIDGKRPHGNPLDWPTARCRDLRSRADGEGIDIFAVAANNDFSNPVPEVREAQICFMRELIRMTADFGAPTLRVFLAWWGVTRHPATGHLRHRRGLLADRPREILQRGDLGLVPRCPDRVRRYAGDAGVTLALQNHKPLIKDHNDVLRMVERGRLSPPEGLPRRSPHARQERSRPFARRPRRSARSRCCRTSAANSSDGPTGRSVASTETTGSSSEDTNQYYRDFVRAMNEIGYEGYLGYELCHQLPVVDGQTVGIEFADQNAELAAEFMRELIDAEVAVLSGR